MTTRRTLTIGLIVAASTTAYLLAGRSAAPSESPPTAVAEASAAEVRAFCAACHAYPSPESFPRAAWRKEVKRAYDFFRDSELHIDAPSMEAVARYYENHSPETLTLVPPSRSAKAFGVRYAVEVIPPIRPTNVPAVSSLDVVDLGNGPELLACEMRGGEVLAFKPSGGWRSLGRVPHPARAEVVDLDRDGVRDVVVADLGNFSPTDDRVGGVVWLRGGRDGKFTPVTLLNDVGRVADVRPADFDGDGDTDLVVAVFGWRREGGIVLLENRTTDPAKPSFVPRVLDGRHGAIHVPVADLDGDGRPDFVALFSQEHEEIVAFLNDGKGGFRRKSVFAAPQPGFGSSGIQLADINADGRLDVVHTNGDMFDSPPVLNPVHGVRWLENRGDYPFSEHLITALPGAHRAIAADADGDGDLDIVATSFLPPATLLPSRLTADLDSVVLLEQTSPGVFARHPLEWGKCDRVACAVGDLFGEGSPQLFAGNFTVLASNPLDGGVTAWRGHRLTSATSSRGPRGGPGTPSVRRHNPSDRHSPP